jgi:hypothetical protein
MDCHAVYRDISPGYVVFDTLSDTVVARRLNAPPLIGHVRAVTETGGRRS